MPRIWLKLLRLFATEQPFIVDDMRATVAAVASHLPPFNARAEYERDLALWESNPLAFWLRPDRNEHKEPCWMIEAPLAFLGLDDAYNPNRSSCGMIGWGLGKRKATIVEGPSVYVSDFGHIHLNGLLGRYAPSSAMQNSLTADIVNRTAMQQYQKMQEQKWFNPLGGLSRF